MLDLFNQRCCKTVEVVIWEWSPTCGTLREVFSTWGANDVTCRTWWDMSWTRNCKANWTLKAFRYVSFKVFQVLQILYCHLSHCFLQKFHFRNYFTCYFYVVKSRNAVSMSGEVSSSAHILARVKLVSVFCLRLRRGSRGSHPTLISPSATALVH